MAIAALVIAGDVYSLGSFSMSSCESLLSVALLLTELTKLYISAWAAAV
jgi:hypothetical protein